MRQKNGKSFLSKGFMKTLEVFLKENVPAVGTTTDDVYFLDSVFLLLK